MQVHRRRWFFCHPFPLWRLLLVSGSYKKHTLVFVPRCRRSTALPVSTERTVQPNQMTLFLGLLRTLRPLFFWALLYGKWFRQDRIFHPFTMKWMDFNLFQYFPDLQKKGSWWCISHSSFPYTYCMLLWQSMCKCNFPGYLSERRMSHNYPLCRNQTDTNSDAAPVENIRRGSFGYSSPSVKQHAYSLI